ncbi:DUF2795 domain-containing protein [Microbacterium enclense]|uniref:DUF2795 domain-containing protein n=1 Tax=Microbacterium enclense TaxID=993073 RepID=UPI001F990180|nr:DUF2795 domain-containing protein [Actinomycetota bacterium]
MADLPNAIELQKYLGGVDYPVGRNELIGIAEDNGAPEEVLERLRASDVDRFDSPTEVSSAVGG